MAYANDVGGVGPLRALQEEELRMNSRTTSRRNTEAERRANRLAELVSELTGCEPTGALHAVREHQDEDRPDALSLVARAMIDIDAAPPEGFRVPAFIEAEDGTEILDLGDDPPLRPTSPWDPTDLSTPADQAAGDDFGRRLAHARSRVEHPRRDG